MKEYLSLFRFGNGIIGIFGIVVGALLAGGTGGIADNLPWIVIGCAIVVVFMGGGNALNDYIDRDIDVTAHPERPIPSGRLRPETARNLGGIMMVLSVLMAIPLAVLDTGCGWITAAMVAICAVLMTLYEVAFKQRGLVGNLTIAFLTAMIFIVGGSLVGEPWKNLVFGGMAFLVNVGREISKDIEDKDSDIGRTTLPMSIGAKNAAYVASAFFILGPVLSLYPLLDGGQSIAYYLVFIADAIFLYCSYIVGKDAHKAQKMAKIAMVVALVAFILDVIV